MYNFFYYFGFMITLIIIFFFLILSRYNFLAGPFRFFLSVLLYVLVCVYSFILLYCHLSSIHLQFGRLRFGLCMFISLCIQLFFFLLFFFGDVFHPFFIWEFCFECSPADLFSLIIILIHFRVFVSDDSLFVFISEFCIRLSF